MDRAAQSLLGEWEADLRRATVIEGSAPIRSRWGLRFSCFVSTSCDKIVAMGSLSEVLRRAFARSYDPVTGFHPSPFLRWDAGYFLDQATWEWPRRKHLVRLVVSTTIRDAGLYR